MKKDLGAVKAEVAALALKTKETSVVMSDHEKTQEGRGEECEFLLKNYETRQKERGMEKGNLLKVHGILRRNDRKVKKRATVSSVHLHRHLLSDLRTYVDKENKTCTRRPSSYALCTHALDLYAQVTGWTVFKRVSCKFNMSPRL